MCDIYAVGATATVAVVVLLLCGTAVNKVIRWHGQIKLIRRSRAGNMRTILGRTRLRMYRMV